ncbi:MAG: hypothetical protein KJ914_10825 [Gammaproteobacteria bacterium]|nr:hypothetical protein [Gammaproteobacteria bacterium]MBU1723743.1 hypothetical protein [Gammaproteobacteria bacterium]MBU2004066.1 hypothetical protein [Gammaproteobacteria bacterium]
MLTVKLLQEMAQDIARLLLKRFRSEHEQVECSISASRMNQGVRVELTGVLSTGEVLFAIQSDLYSVCLDESMELNQKVKLYRA